MSDSDVSGTDVSRDRGRIGFVFAVILLTATAVALTIAVVVYRQRLDACQAGTQFCPELRCPDGSNPAQAAAQAAQALADDPAKLAALAAAKAAADAQAAGV